MGKSKYRNIVDWVPLADVPAIVETETGQEPSRQTVYNWVKRGWLKIADFKPKRTTRVWIRECLDEHLRVGK